MDTKELENEILRRMPPARKLEVMHSLIRQAYDLKTAAIRADRPELSEREARILAGRAIAGHEGDPKPG